MNEVEKLSISYSSSFNEYGYTKTPTDLDKHRLSLPVATAKYTLSNETISSLENINDETFGNDNKWDNNCDRKISNSSLSSLRSSNHSASLNKRNCHKNKIQHKYWNNVKSNRTNIPEMMTISSVSERPNGNNSNEDLNDNFPSSNFSNKRGIQVIPLRTENAFMLNETDDDIREIDRPTSTTIDMSTTNNQKITEGKRMVPISKGNYNNKNTNKIIGNVLKKDSTRTINENVTKVSTSRKTSVHNRQSSKYNTNLNTNSTTSITNLPKFGLVVIPKMMFEELSFTFPKNFSIYRIDKTSLSN
ncbi:hypothetical protein SNEBB_007971 [Seison nebaliae]|nr:hypothetical protein SNEBB_007971 [Seison nebaliae]